MIQLSEYISKMKKSIWASFLSSGLLIVFAFILLFKEADILSTFVLVVGFCGLVVGGVHLLMYFRSEKKLRIYNNDILQALVCFFFGALALLKNDVLADILAYLLGAYLIYKNASRLQICLHLRIMEERKLWNYLGLVSGIGLLVGVLIVWNPFQDQIALTTLISYCLLFSESFNCLQSVILLMGMRKMNEAE